MGLQNLSTAPPPAVLGKLRVEATDPLFPDVPANYMSFRAETGSVTGRYVFTFLGGREVEVPAGKYTISLYDSPWHTAGEKEAVEPGRTTQVDMVLVFVNGFLDVSVTDGKTGQELAGLDVAVSGPVSDGPFPGFAGLHSRKLQGDRSEIDGEREALQGEGNDGGGRCRAQDPGHDGLDALRGTAGRRPHPHHAGRAGAASGRSGKTGPRSKTRMARRSPGTSIVWTSSAPAVAGIDAAGELTGVSAGKASSRPQAGGLRPPSSFRFSR